MLLKSADDKSKRLHLLETLQNADVLDATQRKWLHEEVVRVTKGLQGERDSAYYIDSYFKDSANHVVLHDLRLVVDGDVAQIDHLIFNRGLGAYLIETKNYAGNLDINERGEFTASYGRMQFGVPSPLEQSKRHERVLLKCLHQLGISGRMQSDLRMIHLVMLHPKAIIHRPPAAAFDTSNVIKADQFPQWHRQFIDGVGVATVLKAAVNMRSLDTLADWGRKLMQLHQPADPLALPAFMQPKHPVHGWAVAPTPDAAGAEQASAADTTPPTKRLLCAECGSKISYAEGKYCWNQPQRFGGLQYCREHQRQFTG